MSSKQSGSRRDRNRRGWIAPAALTVVLLASAPAVRADIISGTDCLPQHKYIEPGPIQYPTQSGTFVLTDIVHGNFTNCFAPPGPSPGATSTENFGSMVYFLVNGNPFFAPAQVSVALDLVSVNGPVRVFDTEMLQLDIAGGTQPAGVMIRESPTLASTGETTITDIGGGLFQIHSFFDVFTELSLDGGSTWTPGAQPGHVVLVAEPTPLALLLLGAGLIGWRTRRRRLPPA